jgi:AraC-like DNA-binding protein
MRHFFQNQQIKFIKAMRFNSIFFKAIFILFVLIFIIIIGFYSYVNASYQAAYKNKRVDETLTVLAAVNREVDLNVSTIAVQAQDILKGEETLSMAISGNADSFYPIDIALALYTFAARNTWVDSATLYIESMHVMMDSEKNIRTSEPDTLFLEHPYAGEDYLRWYDGELYYMTGFPAEKHLAVMAICLDRAQMFRYLVDEANMDFGRSFLYFEDVPVFDAYCSYPKILPTSIDFTEKLSEQAALAKENAQGKLKLRYTSQKTGFEWLMDMEAAYLYPELRDVLLQMYPFLLGIFVLTAGAFYYMLNYVYKPIKQVMVSVEGYNRSLDKSEARNELDKIQHFFEANQQKQALLARALSSVEQEVADRFILNLAQDDQMDADYVSRLLSEIHTPYREPSRYQVMLLKRRTTNDNDYQNMYVQIRFLHQLREFWREKANSCAGETPSGDILIVHQYPAKQSSVTIKRFLSLFESYLSETEAADCYALGIGRVYDKLMQLHQSYIDADANAMTRMTGNADKLQERSKRDTVFAEQGKEVLHIEHAKAYIKTHFHDSSLSLIEVSEACGINSSYLSRLFVEYLSQGFLTYLNKQRIAFSETLLIETALTVSEIAVKSGFNSPQSYIRVFKKYNRETPGLFRARKGGSYEKA